MILIVRGQLNDVYLTLTEKSTLTNPYYLFKFTNDTTKEIKRFIATDTSEFTYRYNKFAITEGCVDSSHICLQNGFWSYEVYEQLSATNLSEWLCDNINALEVGKVKVISTTTPNAKYDRQDNTRKTYNG